MFQAQNRSMGTLGDEVGRDSDENDWKIGQKIQEIKKVIFWKTELKIATFYIPAHRSDPLVASRGGPHSSRCLSAAVAAVFNSTAVLFPFCSKGCVCRQQLVVLCAPPVLAAAFDLSH